MAIALSITICVNLVRFTRSNAFCQSKKQQRNITSMASVLIVLSASHMHPKLLSKPNLIFSNYILNFPFSPSS